MTDNPVSRFWRELRRRRVIRVAVVYAIVAWVAVEVSSVLFPALLLPEWSSRLVVALSLIGFPVALALAWAFQVTPEGVRKDDASEIGEEPTRSITELAEPTDEDRLDGWKRIARHMNRDVRTVRRWEKHQGLPVRRLMHDKQASVYAYRSELDAWLEQRDQVSATPKAEKTAGDKRIPDRRWLLLVLPLLVLGGFLAWYEPKEVDAPINLGEWDWVLITRFDNRTGEEVLDDTLEYALQRELANSAYVKVAPQSRINDALSLMKLPPDTHIDLETAREIGLRDGGIRMLITGRVEKLGGNYLLSTELVNPVDGVTMASFSTEASAQDEILGRVGDLARDVRIALGEELASIQAGEEMLSKVTTPSLEALRLYTLADAAMGSGVARDQAVPILEEAVRIDPNFASAHILLVYVLQDQDRMEQADHHLQLAVELADTTSEQERLFILATYYFYYLNDYPKAIETYQMMARLYPDHPWAAGNLGNIYEWQGLFEKALPLRVLKANVAPNSMFAHYTAIQNAIILGEPEIRDEYLARLAAMSESNYYLELQIRFHPLHEAWINGDFEAVEAGVEEVIASTDRDAMVNNGLLFAHVRSLLMALGKLERLGEVSAWRDQPGWFEAVIGLDSGRPEAMDRFLSRSINDFWGATLLAVDGQTDRARAVIEDPATVENVPPPFQVRSWRNLAKGHLALAEGRYEEAIALIDEDQFLLSITNLSAHMFGLHSKALAHIELGEIDAAIETLEIAARQKPMSIFEFGGTWMWMRNQVLLRDLYLRTEQTAAAAAIEADLREVLRLADPDHPILLALER